MNNRADLSKTHLWFYQNKHKLNLNCFKREWSLPFKEILPKYYTCSFLTFNNKTSFGIYTSNDQLTSMTVSLIEALERVLLVENNLKSSNGCAVHTDPTSCKNNAIEELIERDLYMRIHFTGSAIKSFPQKKDTIEDYATQELNRLGVKLTFGTMGSFNEKIAVMAIADGRYAKPKSFGVFLGFGVAENIQQATSKAFNECIRFVDGFFSKEFPYSPLTFDDFSKLNKVGVDEHISLSMDNEYSSFLMNAYTGEKQLEFPPPPQPHIQTTIKSVKLKGVADCPLFFAKAESEDLISPSFSNNPQHLFLKGHIPQDKILKYNDRIAFHILG